MKPSLAFQPTNLSAYVDGIVEQMVTSGKLSHFAKLAALTSQVCNPQNTYNNKN